MKYLQAEKWQIIDNSGMFAPSEHILNDVQYLSVFIQQFKDMSGKIYVSHNHDGVVYYFKE